MLDKEHQRELYRFNQEELVLISLTIDYIFRAKELELLCVYDFFTNYRALSRKYCQGNDKTKRLEEEYEKGTDRKFQLHPQHPFVDIRHISIRKMQVITDLIGSRIPYLSKLFGCEDLK